MRGINDAEESVENGLLVDAELGLPSLQFEAKGLLEDKCRSGKCNSASVGGDWEVAFGHATYEAELTVTQVELLGFARPLLGYGGTIPQLVDGPINDRCGNVVSGRNQSLSIHLAAGGVRSTKDRPGRPSVMKEARAARCELYQQAGGRHGGLRSFCGQRPPDHC